MGKPEDIVTVHCYGKAEKYVRSAAIQTFTEAISFSEGSERERYSLILTDLLVGKKIASDGEPLRG